MRTELFPKDYIIHTESLVQKDIILYLDNITVKLQWTKLENQTLVRIVKYWRFSTPNGTICFWFAQKNEAFTEVIPKCSLEKERHLTRLTDIVSPHDLFKITIITELR